MKRRSLRNVVAALVLVTASASSAAAQQPASPTGGALSPAAGTHSMWRDVLIGGVVGTGFGAGIGAMRKNFHETECVFLSCNRTFEADTLAPIGAAIGAFGGWLTHVVRNHAGGGSARMAPPASSTASARQPTFLVTPTYSPNRKGIQLRAQF